MRRGKRETERERQELNCSAHLKLHISDAYKLLQPVRIKYAMDNWWALDIKSVLVAHTACLCAHMCVCVCVCVCAYNWWGLDRDAGRPPEEIRATLPMSCRLRKKKKKTNHASCLAYCPLHLYLQHHCAWITTSLRNWTLGTKCKWTHTHRGTHCMHERKLPRTCTQLMDAPSSEIIIMITKACYVFSIKVTSARTQRGAERGRRAAGQRATSHYRG